MKNKFVHYLLVSVCLIFGSTVFGKDLDEKNNGYYFSGQGEFISIEQNFPESNYSLSLWFRTTKDSTGLLSVRDSDLGVSNDRNIWIMDNHVQHRLFYEEVIGSEKLVLSDNNWHNLVVVVDQLHGQFIYIDGKKVASGLLTKSEFDWDNVLNLGYAGWGDQNFFEGWMKNVELYDNVLSAEIILNKFRGENYKNLSSNLLGNWKLFDNLKDSSDYNNHGILRFFSGNKSAYLTVIHGDYLLNDDKKVITEDLKRTFFEARKLALEKLPSFNKTDLTFLTKMNDNVLSNEAHNLGVYKTSAEKYDENIKSDSFKLLETVGANLFLNHSNLKTKQKKLDDDFVYHDISLEGEDYVLLKKSVFQLILFKFLAIK